MQYLQYMQYICFKKNKIVNLHYTEMAKTKIQSAIFAARCYA